MKRLSVLLAVLLLGTHFALPVAAADDYPQRPVTLVVPWAAGGNTDAVSRVIASALGARLGKSMVVENRAGANGQIGAASVARAAPDGYTLLVASAETHSITSPSRNMPYEPLKVFEAIGPFAINPFMIVARAGLPVQDVKSLVAYARSHPGKLTYGSWGTGSTGQIAMEMFKAEAGIDVLHVPFNGTAPAESALLGEHIDLLIMPVGRAAAVRPSGKINVLGAMTAARTDLMPDIPTLRDAGYANVVAANWFGLVAPAGTPAAIIARVSAALDAVLTQPELQAAFRARGVEMMKASPPDFLRFIADEQVRWSSTVIKANIRFD
ncbi:MAG: Bug family tripartite tricarboxylate transporter substrate binding protein [Lautropia sp.]